MKQQGGNGVLWKLLVAAPHQESMSSMDGKEISGGIVG
jgi:hypothetical protein